MDFGCKPLGGILLAFQKIFV